MKKSWTSPDVTANSSDVRFGQGAGIGAATGSMCKALMCVLPCPDVDVTANSSDVRFEQGARPGAGAALEFLGYEAALGGWMQAHWMYSH